MLKALRGFFLTINTSPGLAIREALRRLTRKHYYYRGVPIRSEADFRTVRKALSRDMNIWGDDGNIYLNTWFGVLSVPRLNLVYSVLDDIEYYKVVNVKDKTVLDIGAYIGDTTLFFVSRGAKRIYAYEPVFYKILLKNISLNKITDKVEVVPRGIYYKPKTICVKEEAAGTGLRKGDVCFETITLREAIARHSPDVAKMDCEGCEYSILATPCSSLTRVGEWVIEVHGAESVIIDYMEDCGFSHKIVGRPAQLISLVYFEPRK